MHSPRYLSALLMLVAGIGALRAQTPAPESAKEAPVVLSPFTVSTDAAARYQATESTSGTRVRVSLLDSTQSVAVVTRDLIDDISAGRVVDAAKYVSGVYDSTIPNAQDRTTVRGFQSDGATVDGFNYFSFANLDPVIIDRIEVVKGPNAITAPQGVPGGTVNNITKRPVFQDQGYVSLQAGRYASNRAEFDVNRVLISDKLALRVVGASTLADDYADGNYHHSNIAMPMVTYRPSASTELTVQAEWYNWWALDYVGVPISLYTTSTSSARLLDGLSRTFSPVHDDIPRHQKAHHYRAFFTTQFTENLSMRVAANYIQSSGKSNAYTVGSALNQVAKIDPATGLTVWDGTTRNDNPVFPIGGSLNSQFRTYANLQNDFVYDFKRDNFKSSTVAGYAYNFTNTRNEVNYNITLNSPQSLTNYVWSPYTVTTVSSANTRTYRDQQVYAYEQLTLFKDYLLLSGGVSKNWYWSRNYDILRNLHAGVAPDVTLPSFGAVLKLTPNTSIYYGYSELASAINPSTTSTNYFKTQDSRQHEGGVRGRFLNGSLYVTLAYFDIKQNNYSVPNPGNNVVPAPSPLLPPLFMDRLAHGGELEFNYAVNASLSFIGNATLMRNRDPNNVPFRGTAERSGALWANYSFKDTALKGLTLGLGADYLDKRPGDAASGFTSAGVPNQPTFWLAARTLVNASVSYRYDKHWKAQLNVENLLNKDYLAASLSRTQVYPGMPINPRLTVTYGF